MENTKVKGLLLIWNPENADWNYKEACLKVKNGEKSEIVWRTSRKNGVEEKTEVFLIKLGEESKGIIAHGHVMEEPYLKDERYYINVEFDKILDYENEEFLKQEDLVLKFPEQKWNPQASGIEIKETILPELKKMWDELVKKDN
jgi:hypothetical protein